MASAIDLTLDDDDSVELMGPPVTDLTADSQDSLPPPRRAPATAAPAAAPVATESQQEAPAALQQDAAPAPAPDAPPAPPPPRPGTLLARKAKFSYFDTFEDTDDELETTHELRIESARADDQKIRCACFADLHRHQWDKAYFVGEGEDRRRVDTAEWFRDHAPADIGLAIFAGDLGLEQNDELATESGRGIDRRAKGIQETGYEKELASVEAWATLFRDIIDARPRCHIIVIGGNHDGLLCDDDLCDSCGAMDRVAHRWQTERRRPWGRTAREATDAVVRLLQGSYPGQIHVLRETHVDVDVETIGGGTSPLRVIGSPSDAADPLDGPANQGGPNPLRVRPQRHPARRPRGGFRKVDSLLKRADCDRGVIMVAHGPPYGILDLVQRERRCGCDAFAQALSQHKAPSLCVFGHVHAQQSDEESGPRGVSRRHPGTLFANAASEMKTPDITGCKLMDTKGRYDDEDDAAAADGPRYTGPRLQGGPRPARRSQAQVLARPERPRAGGARALGAAEAARVPRAGRVRGQPREEATRRRERRVMLLMEYLPAWRTLHDRR